MCDPIYELISWSIFVGFSLLIVIGLIQYLFEYLRKCYWRAVFEKADELADSKVKDLLDDLKARGINTIDYNSVPDFIKKFNED